MSKQAPKKIERPIIYDLVRIDHEREVVTTSLIIAERFDRNHKDVMKAIRAIIDGPPRNTVSRRKNAPRDLLSEDQKAFADRLRKEFAKNFREVTYRDDRGKEQPMFILNADASRKLIMGFVGEKADVWQFLFVRAFSEMEKELQRQRQNLADPERQLERAAGIEIRKSFTEICSEFEVYGLTDGREKGSGKSYLNYSKEINKHLFAPEDGVFKDIRKRRLTTQQLKDIATVERVAGRALRQAMDGGRSRDECWPAVLPSIIQLCGLIGKTSVPPLKDVQALPGMEDAA